MSLADQKYESFFNKAWGIDDIKKECIFKELYNLNHQLNNLLRQAENKANAECMRAERNKKLLNSNPSSRGMNLFYKTFQISILH